MQCPICGNKGSCQLFLNKSGRVTYARVRHYKGKGKFTYCKIEDLKKLETLISLNFQFPTVKPQAKTLGQDGQGTNNKIHDQTSASLLSGQLGSSVKLRMAGPLGFEPRTFSLEG
jgi:hypothetical protein